MKGVVFNMLEYAVERGQGPDEWDDLLATAGVGGAYTAVGSYPDEELGKLVTALAARMAVEPGEAIRWFARASVPFLVERYPEFFRNHRSVRSFLGTLDSIVHPEVRKLYPGAVAPSFDVRILPDGSVSLAYRSPRALCTFAQGLVEGSATHFGEEVTVHHRRCVHRGDDVCELVCAGRWND